MHDMSCVARHVTVSIGIATAHCTNKISTESIIKLADAQLYAAKLKGRNQVLAADLEHASGPPPRIAMK
jgi:diguanylate cyclase (GGDEF)-like protein